MATLSLFEDYSVDNFSKSFLANKLKVDYDKLDSLVLSHLEKLKVIEIQAWIHHTQGSSERHQGVKNFRSNFRSRKVFEGVQYHVLDMHRKCTFSPESYFESGPKVYILTV